MTNKLQQQGLFAVVFVLLLDAVFVLLTLLVFVLLYAVVFFDFAFYFHSCACCILVIVQYIFHTLYWQERMPITEQRVVFQMHSCSVTALS